MKIKPTPQTIEELASAFFEEAFTESDLIDFAYQCANIGATIHKEQSIEIIERETRLPEPPTPEDYSEPENYTKLPKPGNRVKDNLPMPDFGELNI